MQRLRRLSRELESELGSQEPVQTHLKVVVIGDRSSYALQLTEALHRQDVECLFYGPKTSPIGDVKRAIVFSGFRNYKPVWTTVGYAYEILRELSKDRPQVVHFDFTLTIFGQNYLSLFPLAVLIPVLRILGYKVVLTVHDVVSKEILRDVLGNAPIMRRVAWPALRAFYGIMSLSNLIVVHLQVLRRMLQSSFAIDSRKVLVVPFGVKERPESSRESLTRWLNEIGEGPIVLFFGVIAPRKGVEYLVEAFSRLSQEYPSAKLVLAGPVDSKDRGYLAEILEGAGKLRAEGRLLWLGYLEEEDAHSLLEISRVVALPYVYAYASPSILYWAIQHRKPVIASRVETLAEELTGYSDELLFEPRNVQQIAKSLLLILSDEELVKEASRFMDSKAAANDWAQVGKRLVRTYLNLMKG